MIASAGIADNPRINLAKVQHIHRMVSSNQFPNYLADQRVQDYILKHMASSLIEYYKASEVSLPSGIGFNRTSGTGKLRNELSAIPPGDFDLHISILSAISRESYTLNKRWYFDIMVSDGKKVVLSKSIEYQLEPYSITNYLTQASWIGMQEFASLFTQSIDEVLGFAEPRNNPVKLGSDIYVNNLIQLQIPGFTTSLIAVKGGMILQGNTAFSLDNPKERVVGFSYRNRGWNINQRQDFDDKSKEVLKLIMGSFPEGRFIRSPIRHGMYEFNDGSLLYVRYDVVSFRESAREINYAPDMIQLYDEQELKGRFFFFSQANEMQDMNSLDMMFDYRDEGSFGNGGRHILQGSLNDILYIVEFEERLNMIYIKTETDTEAIVALHNLNPLSNSFGGLIIGHDRRRITQRNISNPNVDDEDAEWYVLFTKPGATEAEQKDYALLFSILFFAMAVN